MSIRMFRPKSSSGVHPNTGSTESLADWITPTAFIVMIGSWLTGWRSPRPGAASADGRVRGRVRDAMTLSVRGALAPKALSTARAPDRELLLLVTKGRPRQDNPVKVRDGN